MEKIQADICSKYEFYFPLDHSLRLLALRRYGLFAGVPLVARSEEKRLYSQIYCIKIPYLFE